MILGDEKERLMAAMLADMNATRTDVSLASESIITLVQQHMASPGTSRLPVLIVAAAYDAAADQLGERVLPLQRHNAADKQTGALGDVEIVIQDEIRVVTCYEMKQRRVTREDIAVALQKISARDTQIDNYIFITTEMIDNNVAEYARSLYDQTGGVEFTILDCVSFLRHFLHLFHRLRTNFLDAYQRLLLAEPYSAVNAAIKLSFLALRQAAQTPQV